MPVITLPLDSLHSCARTLALLDKRALTVVAEAIDDAANALEVWGGNPPWPPALRDAIGLLLMYAIAADRTPALERLARAAARAASRMSADGPGGAWYAAFHEHLPYAHRSGVLAAAAHRDVTMPIPDLVWWTAKCRLDLAIEWVATVRIDDAESLQELVGAATAYIHLLQNEPCRRAMERFYAAAGTRAEKEVLRAHAVREEYTTIDEFARADVMTWLLRRYALRETWQLLKGTLRTSEKIGAAAAAILSLAGLVIFFTQTFPRWQVLLQMSGFVCLVFLSPRIFALAMPRALFGTLLAWITVVLAQSASLLPLVGGDSDAADVRGACHRWLQKVIHPGDDVPRFFGDLLHLRAITHFPELLDFSGVVLVCLSVSIVFLTVEVSTRLSTRLVRRSVDCVGVMLVGSLFWGAMLVPTLQYIVAREPLGTSCGCVYPAWLLGSVCAVAFGILVQLMWDDRAVSESLGVPGSGGAR